MNTFFATTVVTNIEMDPSYVIMTLDRSVYFNSLRYILSILQVSGNFFVLFLVCKYERLRRSQCNIFIAILAFTNIGTGVGLSIRATYTLYAASKDPIYFAKLPCVFANIVQASALYASQVAIVAIAVDRFNAVWRPLKYVNDTSSFRIVFVCLLTGLTAVGVIVTSFYGFVDSGPIVICTMGAAGSPHFGIWSQYYVQIMSLILVVLYAITLVLFIRGKSFNNKFQRRVTRSVFVIISMYLLFWGLPALAILITTWFASSMTLYFVNILGVTTGVDGALYFFVYLITHNEIRQCTNDFVGRICNRKSRGRVVLLSSGRQSMQQIDTTTNRIDVRGST
ncbi:serpentine type 7TM GPCR chemoreceptor srsx domain-containing protein [Ditylenchus destructor]|nr:serpentine type 7TM GPCR chemoreceptor srsx domain-containing protein [Ditylenchus destructor]